MNEERLEAYLSLIDCLINCDDGEEMQILENHKNLLDYDFIKFIKKYS
ncbi:hypothetical protein [Microseira wollei]|uniref:Uncharacterized protein n=1 Tax=Microseira wollei NIES-4236 TaxID=2530354 RepID=A0AAV3XEV3_9CYAN|nr:hypothetical protein [Microseira wollei]GET39961.1 hypothetical protein MiSe_47340 [Microseira wollei NIES-4236]